MLAEKQAEADAALAQITQSMSGATEQKTDMEQLKSATEAENVKIEEQKKLIERQLADVTEFKIGRWVSITFLRLNLCCARRVRPLVR